MKWFNVRNGYGFINRYFIHFFNTYSHCLVSRSDSDLFCFPQEWYQGRCVCSSGKARPKFGDSWLVLVTFVVFFPQTAIKKNNPRKFLRSVGDGEVVEFDVIEAVKVSTSNLNLFKKKKKTRMEDFFSPNIALLNVTLNSRKRVHEKRLVQQERGWQRGQMKWRKQVSAKNEMTKMTKKSEGKNE